jgi:hypothetical protein
MNIAELITEVGVDNTRVQFLDSCADTMSWSAKQGITKITFGTEEPLTPEGLAKCGIVVWLPRDAVNAAIAKERGV